MTSSVRLRIWGGMPGYQDSGGVLVNETADGVSLDVLFEEIEQVTALYNNHKNTLVNLLSYETDVPADAIPQSLTAEQFQEASQYGVPRAISPPTPYLKVGYQYRDYDAATRFTWKFLRDSTAEQLRAQVTRIIEGDQRLVQSLVLDRLFSPVEESNEWQHRVFGLYTGSDAITPPALMGKTFQPTHSHYIATGSTDLDSEDIELMMSHVTEHGYGQGGGSGRLVILTNPAEAEMIASWRAGATTANSKVAKFDFIPSANVPPFLTSETVVGATPPTDLDGVPVLGSYGKGLVVESNVVPQGWLTVFATHGPNHPDNVVARRVHPKPQYQGLRYIRGNFERYPLIESQFARGIGVGTRHRGAAVVAQLTTNPSYTAPTIVV